MASNLKIYFFVQRTGLQKTNGSFRHQIKTKQFLEKLHTGAMNYPNST